MPAGARGRGVITVSMDGATVRLEVGPDDGGKETRFDRFGIVTTWIDGNGQRVFFDDLTYTAGQ